MSQVALQELEEWARQQALQSDLGPALRALSFPDEWCALYVWLAREASRPDSRWAPYFGALPREIDTPVCWADELLELLRGSNLYDAVQKIRGDLERTLRTVQACADLPQSLRESLSAGELRWAYAAFWSRALGLQVDGEQVGCLVPLADMLNHAPDAATAYLVDSPPSPAGERRFRLRCLAPQPLAPGQQAFQNYGRRSNEKFLLNYGFLGSPEDASCMVKLGISPQDALRDAKRELLAACGLALEQYLLPHDPLPASLLAAARICLADEALLYLYRSAPDRCGRALEPRREQHVLATLERLLEERLARFRPWLAAPPAPPAPPASPAYRLAEAYHREQTELLRSAARLARQARFALAPPPPPLRPPPAPAPQTALQVHAQLLVLRGENWRLLADLRAGEVLLELPTELVLRANMDALEADLQAAQLAARLCQERRCPRSKAWRAFLDAAARVECAALLDEAGLEARLVHGTRLQELREELREAWLQERPAVAPEASPEEYLAARALVERRQILAREAGSERRVACLLALPDLPALAPDGCGVAQLEPDGRLCVVLERDMPRGSELLLQGGLAESAWQTLVQARPPERGACDLVPLRIAAAPEDPLCEWKAARLETEHFVTCPLSPLLLRAMCLAALHPGQEHALSTSPDAEPPAELEVRALLALRGLLESLELEGDPAQERRLLPRLPPAARALLEYRLAHRDLVAAAMADLSVRLDTLRLRLGLQRFDELVAADSEEGEEAEEEEEELDPDEEQAE